MTTPRTDTKRNALNGKLVSPLIDWHGLALAAVTAIAAGAFAWAVACYDQKTTWPERWTLVGFIAGIWSLLFSILIAVIVRRTARAARVIARNTESSQVAVQRLLVRRWRPVSPEQAAEIRFPGYDTATDRQQTYEDAFSGRILLVVTPWQQPADVVEYAVLRDRGREVLLRADDLRIEDLLAML